MSVVITSWLRLTCCREVLNMLVGSDHGMASPLLKDHPWTHHHYIISQVYSLSAWITVLFMVFMNNLILEMLTSSSVRALGEQVKCRGVNKVPIMGQCLNWERTLYVLKVLTNTIQTLQTCKAKHSHQKLFDSQKHWAEKLLSSVRSLLLCLVFC